MKRTITAWVIMALVAIMLTSYILTTLAQAGSSDEYDYYVYLPFVLGLSSPAIPYILANHSWYTNAANYLHVVGEVQNSASNDLSFVSIWTYFFDSYGRLIAVDLDHTRLGNLPAGDKTCFDISLPKPFGWVYYEFAQVDYWIDGDPLPNLTVLNDSGSYESYSGRYEIIGTIRNDHGSRIEYVSPVSTLYNASGTVIGCDFTYVNATHLDPGQQSSFEMTFVGRDYADAASYRLQVDGSSQ